MKVLSLFSGIGAFEKAINNLEIPFELVGFSEIDKYATASYCAIHGISESMNLGDITKIDEKALPRSIDLITYGFPCQDISTGGKQKGLFNEDGTRTRSGLFFDALRIIEETKPKFAIAENVKNLTSKKFNAQFQVVLQSLECAGYNNYWKVLNAKNFGIPQNRERVFIVSIRKDIDTGTFLFPEGFPLQTELKDFTEDDVHGKYYIDCDIASQQIIKTISKAIANPNADFTPNEYKTSYALQSRDFAKMGFTDLCGTLQARNYKDPRCIVVKEATKKGYTEAREGDSINIEFPNSKTRRGRVGRAIAQTVTTSPQQIFVEKGLQLRKMTPKEYFRLMGFTDEDFAKAEAVNSNTQLYKQAGNSIVVPVVQAIIKKLLKGKE